MATIRLDLAEVWFNMFRHAPPGVSILDAVRDGDGLVLTIAGPGIPEGDVRVVESCEEYTTMTRWTDTRVVFRPA